eukprot:SAG31_NODE_557_length_14160_cov_18.420880_4_plen_232_part_00
MPQILELCRPIWNLYGPTEATCSCTYTTLEPRKPVDIGISIPTFRCFVGDQDSLTELAPGESGELIVTGISVARGYLNLPHKTAEVFVKLSDGRDAYRTGDRARMDGETGAFMLLGRLDNQVKIHGQRVELEGLEAVLTLGFSSIRQCCILYERETIVVIAVPRLEAEAGSCVNISTVREHMLGKVPDYCLPQVVEIYDGSLGGFPTTTSGKCDRNSVLLWYRSQFGATSS